MDYVTTSLDALLQRATNSNNQTTDVAAVEAFCALVNKEKDGAHIGVKLIATRIHSSNENEVLQTLQILDTCMARCGNAFHAEVGKFRFLNEMIKLVSPKYLGSKTPLSIKQKVLQLMYVWTLDYPKESKIKEAYDMLRKQGVIKEVPVLSVSGDGITPKKPNNSVFQDEEKSKLLQYLLQSKNPEDLQAANRLIKNMVKEDDKRSELKHRKFSELESVHNNSRLLNEMLDSYKPGVSSADELDLINELHQSCERLKPNVLKMASDTYSAEDILNNVLQANEDLNQVLEKYEQIIVLGLQKSKKRLNNLSLLDLESNTNCGDSVFAKLNENADLEKNNTQEDLDVLNDIFNSTSGLDNVLAATEILLPVAAAQDTAKANGVTSTMNSGKSDKMKALEDLDLLSDHLLKENLPNDVKLSKQFTKIPEKISMNSLSRLNKVENVDSALSLDLTYLINKTKDDLQVKDEKCNGDDVLVDVTDDVLLGSVASSQKETKINDEETIKKIKSDVKLSDINVTLESIKPGSVKPLTVLDEKNGISVTLHFAKDRPREDVSVIVITTLSKNELPLSNYLFQAVVPKGCRLKLQPPSSTDLPAHNPFLPPAAITQIMLVANPDNLEVSLKFILSYVIDSETITEMGEVEKLPIN